MQLPEIDYTNVLAKFYPTEQYHAFGDFPVQYENIDFEVQPIAQAELDAKMLNIYQEDMSEQVRKQAEDARRFYLGMVLGTQDQEQIRSYEVKYLEAKAYGLDQNASTPQLSAEAAVTGESVQTLAALVVFQYDSAMDALRPLYGLVDGVRRKALAEIAAATTVDQLKLIDDPAWGY